MDDDHVNGAHQLRQRDDWHRPGIGRTARGAGDHPHTERTELGRGEAADSAQADDAAGQRREPLRCGRGRVPLAGVDIAVGPDDRPRPGQHQGDRMVGDLLDAVVRHVRHQHTPITCRGDGDVVQADSQPCHDPQGRRGDDRGRGDGRPAGHDRRRVVLDHESLDLRGRAGLRTARDQSQTSRVDDVALDEVVRPGSIGQQYGAAGHCCTRETTSRSLRSCRLTTLPDSPRGRLSRNTTRLGTL